MTVQLFPRPLCVVDVETWHPGGTGERHRLIEIGAVLLDEHGYPVDHFQELCRPADLPRNQRSFLGNPIDPRSLAQAPSERAVVSAFADWVTYAGHPRLYAYNVGFDRSAITKALMVAWNYKDDGDPPSWLAQRWGPCLMQTAKAIFGHKSLKKEEAAALALPDPDRALRWMADRLGIEGPLEMHRGLPDALLEAALLVALRRRELAAASSSPSLPAPASGRPSLFGALA